MAKANLIQKETRELKCKLTDEEHKEFALQLAEANKLSVELEGSKKAEMAAWTAKINKNEEEIARLSTLVAEVAEWRDVQCEVHFHKPKHGMKTIIRTDTNEVVTEERMLQRDHNLFTQDEGGGLSDFMVGPGE